MSKKIKKLVDNNLNAGARINHDRRQLAEQTKKKLKSIKLPLDVNPGEDGFKMGPE